MWHTKKLMARNKFNRKYIEEHIDTFERSQTWRFIISEFEEWKLHLGLGERIQAVLTAAVVVVEAMAARRWEVVEAMAAWRWEVEFETLKVVHPLSLMLMLSTRQKQTCYYVAAYWSGGCKIKCKHAVRQFVSWY